MDEVVEIALELGEDRGGRLLLGVGAKAAKREFDRVWAVRYAVALLQQRVPRPQIRDRLMQRYEIERRAAYMRIDEALQIPRHPQLCKSGPQECTAPAQDQVFGDG